MTAGGIEGFARGTTSVLRSMVSTGIVVPLLLLLLTAAVAAWWVRKRGLSERHGALLFAAFASLALVLAATLLREASLLVLALLSDEPLQLPGPAGLLSWSEDGWRSVSYDPFGSTQVLLNILLFVPAGAAWTLLTRSPWRVLAGLIGLSMLVECVQAVTGLGANDVADLLANSAGGALGVGIGSAVNALLPGSARPDRRRVLLTLGTAAVCAVLVTAGLQIGAGQRQDALKSDLEQRFNGTSLEEYAAWEDADQLEELVWFRTGKVASDGTRHQPDLVAVRYPASFFGLRRCVYVEWRPGEAQIRRAAGRDCTRFVG